LAQLVALHVCPPVHWPWVQVCPAWHSAQSAPLLPQLEVLVPTWQLPLMSTQPEQVPVLTQPLLLHACCPVQTWQAPPLEPQAKMVLDGEMHEPLGAQQPLQFWGVHVAAEPQVPCEVQAAPPVQAWQDSPPWPQTGVEVPVWQEPWASQQPGQLDALHAPPTSCDEGHPVQRRASSANEQREAMRIMGHLVQRDSVPSAWPVPRRRADGHTPSHAANARMRDG
jgi:hypothetical protein